MQEKIFENYKPILHKRFTDNVTRTYNRIKEALGPDFKNVYNDWNWAKVFNNVVRPYFNSADHSLIPEKLQAGAEQYADDTIKAWADKIDEKVGMLDEGEVVHLQGSNFHIVGKKQGHDVLIFQQMIINVSVRGTLFNQFPSYIHLDKKRISAKKFKEQFKGK
jgi:hypothetical protein